MQLPGSMNIAPPPEMRRTMPIPCRAAASSSTSLRTDWNEPSTTSGESQSQNRSVGRRSPVATSRVITSSSATCIAGSSTTGSMTSKVWSCQLVAWPSARRIAIPTDSGVNPIRATSSPIFSAIAWPIRVASAVVGSPVTAATMSSSASSGSRKKSPDSATRDSCPSSTSTSTITSLPPGTLYSPRTKRSVSVSATGRWRGNRRHLRCDRRRRRRVTRGGLSASHLRASGL